LATGLATADNRSGPVHTGPVRLCPKIEYVRTGCSPGPRPLRAKNRTGPDLKTLCVIPKDTIILTLAGPYASVIMRKWKKEVCAWCFKWQYAAVPEAASTSTREASAGNFPVPVESHQHGRKWDRKSHFLPGLWHCHPSCLALWIRDFELWEGEEGLWVANILEGFEKALGESIRQEREKRFTGSFGKIGTAWLTGRCLKWLRVR
jgi:hypothetical protein